MRVLHVIPSLWAGHGGPSRALPEMARALSALGVEVDVACTDDAGPGARLEGVPLGVAVPHEGFRVFYFARETEFYKASCPMWRWLHEHAREYARVHIHAVFSFSTWAAARAARRAGVPYIVRPLGVLNAWGMENRRRWLKNLSFRWLDKPLLDAAAAIHYTSAQEEREAARLGLRAPAWVIPLGVDLAPYSALPPTAEFESRWPAAAGREVVLFLSRVDEKKGLDVLVEAFAEIHRARPHALLVIAGDGDATLRAKLETRLVSLGLTEHVVWTGRLEGRDKLAALAAARLYVLPSYSENFGIALLEALAAGKACVASQGVALAQELQPPTALKVVPVGDAPALASACVELLENDTRRASLETGARIAAAAFSQEVAARRLLAAYESLGLQHPARSGS